MTERHASPVPPCSRLAHLSGLLLLVALVLPLPGFAQIVTTVAGGGGGDGPQATDLDLDLVTGLARDAQGRLIVGSHGQIHRIAADGTATRIAGIPGTVTWRPTTGPATGIALGRLKDVATIPAGDVFFADNGPYSRRIDTGGTVSNVTGTGWPGLPAALAADRSGRMHVASPQQVFRADLDAGTVTLVAGNGESSDTGDGSPATEAGFNYIRTIAFDRQNRLLIATETAIRRVNEDGSVKTVVAASRVNGMDVGPDGTLYFTSGSQVMAVDGAGNVAVFAGKEFPESGELGDGGPALEAAFASPEAVLAGEDGSVLVADSGNRRVRRIAAGTPQSVVPAPPPAPSASKIGNDVWVDIQPSLDDGGSPITGYTLTSIPAGAIDPAPGTLQLSRRIQGLAASTSYRFVARATNAVGTSGASAPSTPVLTGPSSQPTLTIEDAEVEEGDFGTRTATVPITLSFPLAADYAFKVSTIAGTATPGADFVSRADVALVIPSNETTVEFSFEVLADTADESDETVFVRVSEAQGLAAAPVDGRVTILDDDQPSAQPGQPVARDDRRVLRENAGRTALHARANDSVSPDALEGSSVGIAAVPKHGIASISNGDIWYEPPADWSGTDEFRYRLCEAQTRCDEATVRLIVRPLVESGLFTVARSGAADEVLSDLRPLPRLELHTTPLVAPHRRVLAAAGDPSPETPWDGVAGTAYALFPLDVTGVAERMVHVRTSGTGGSMEVYLGLDVNGDGQPSADEVRCVDSDVGGLAVCEHLVPAPGAVTADEFWVMLHNREHFGIEVDLSAFEVPLVESDGSLAATGPGVAAAGEAVPVRLAWDDQRLYQPGSQALGYLTVEASPGQRLERVPVIVERNGDQEEPLLLVPGAQRTLVLGAGQDHKRIFFDVPEGTTSLTIETSGGSASAGFSFAHDGRPRDPLDTSIAETLLQGPASAQSQSPGKTVLTAPKPGRWYALAWNRDVQARELGVRIVSVQGQGPEVRRGSYFNAARPGSGLFLYPAGDQWAGLWYTYFEDRTATWYYLQGAAPGTPGGLWTGEVYRVAWHGDGSTLTRVGVATVSPQDPDVFTFNYTVDGYSGSEPMAALGRGCPTNAGAPQDLSSHWFDPTRAGTGFSVQMWENYEYFAAFVYDARGVPRFLAAERNGFGGGESVLNLQQLQGSCPTCSFAAGTRWDVGTLMRRITDGALERIELELVYAHGVPGSWSSADEVQLLGGPGTTQGCAP